MISIARWCNFYNAWCSDVDDITDGMADCDLDCKDCDDCEEIGPRE